MDFSGCREKTVDNGQWTVGPEPSAFMATARSTGRLTSTIFSYHLATFESHRPFRISEIILVSIRESTGSCRYAKVDTFKRLRRQEGLQPLCLTSAEMFAQQGVSARITLRMSTTSSLRTSTSSRAILFFFNRLRNFAAALTYLLPKRVRSCRLAWGKLIMISLAPRYN